MLVEKLLAVDHLGIDEEIGQWLTITYRDQPISALHEASFWIRNIGSETVEDVEITFIIEELDKMTFLEVHLTNSEETLKILGLPGDEGYPDPPTISAQFLNPWKGHEDYLGVTLYAPRDISVRDVTGRGLGWSTRYVDKAVYIDGLTKLLARSAPGLARLALALDAIAARFRRS